ncbi:MAG: helix-turn-helix transcriptional regulator [Lachnospiraceae bacterium]|nr:helix-turn-helix transcriptional regulator [Lachnospiraceae bacterium]
MLTNITQILGQRIRHYRKQQKLSQEKLAELSDLHPTYIGQIERGEKNATIESIYKISLALQIPISQLLEKLDEHKSLESTDFQSHSVSDTDNIPLQIYELVSIEPKENQEFLLRMLTYAIKLKTMK